MAQQSNNPLDLLAAAAAFSGAAPSAASTSAPTPAEPATNAAGAALTGAPAQSTTTAPPPQGISAQSSAPAQADFESLPDAPEDAQVLLDAPWAAAEDLPAISDQDWAEIQQFFAESGLGDELQEQQSLALLPAAEAPPAPQPDAPGFVLQQAPPVKKASRVPKAPSVFLDPARERYNRETKSLRTKVNDADIRVASLTDKLQRSEQTIADQAKQLADLQAKLSTSQQDLLDTRRGASANLHAHFGRFEKRSESDKKTWDAEKQALVAQKEALEAENRGLAEANKSLAGEKDYLLAEGGELFAEGQALFDEKQFLVLQLESAQQHLQDEIKQLQAGHEHHIECIKAERDTAMVDAALSEQVQRLRESQQTMETQQKRYQDEMAVANANHDARIKALQTELDDARLSAEHHHRLYEDQITHIKQVEEQLVAAQASADGRAEQIAKLEDEARAAREQLKRTEDTVRHAESEIIELREEIKERDRKMKETRYELDQAIGSKAAFHHASANAKLQLATTKDLLKQSDAHTQETLRALERSQADHNLLKATHEETLAELAEAQKLHEQLAELTTDSFDQASELFRRGDEIRNLKAKVNYCVQNHPDIPDDDNLLEAVGPQELEPALATPHKVNQHFVEDTSGLASELDGYDSSDNGDHKAQQMLLNRSKVVTLANLQPTFESEPPHIIVRYIKEIIRSAPEIHVHMETLTFWMFMLTFFAISFFLVETLQTRSERAMWADVNGWNRRPSWSINDGSGRSPTGAFIEDVIIWVLRLDYADVQKLRRGLV